ncbi:hotdog fold thioesterase [Kineococcus endophyticus]
MWQPAAVTGTAPSIDEILATFAADTLVDRLGIRFLEMSPERLVATMPVEGNTQVAGFLHGGASCALAETLGSVGAYLHVWPGGLALGTDINATHHRSVRSGLVTGVATAISLGRTLCSHEVVISDEEGRRLCTARITNYVRAAQPS